MKRIVFLLLTIITVNALAQKTVSIPAYTAYAIPAETADDNGESKLFSAKNGLHNWTDKNQRIQFYCNLKSTGKLNIDLLLKNSDAGNVITVSLARNTFPFKGGRLLRLQ